ncbi:hypothetical protein COU80_02475 [Candidatus Peregrinibacteria bacterium CG10_big_fil_rev_8_21_14_0_10_55_24]|nr:MAG: hypothetical protein COU80_02475 [Candidatus Peregrinibacteria bacterium CG10_big_fil_rev_8_21_14_0_10_55_24]
MQFPPAPPRKIARSEARSDFTWDVAAQPLYVPASDHVALPHILYRKGGQYSSLIAANLLFWYNRYVLHTFHSLIMEQKKLALGVVLGLAAGVITTLAVEDTILQAQVFGEPVVVAYRGMDIRFDRQYYKRRAVNERDQETEPRAQDQISVPSSVKAVPASPRQTSTEGSADCSLSVPIVAEIERQVFLRIPTGRDYLQLRAGIARYFETIAYGDCARPVDVEGAQAPEHSSAASPVARVNNHCDEYAKDTQRYTRCIVNEREGQRYIGTPVQR